jgi:hypothetical protein
MVIIMKIELHEITIRDVVKGYISYLRTGKFIA